LRRDFCENYGVFRKAVAKAFHAAVLVDISREIV